MGNGKGGFSGSTVPLIKVWVINRSLQIRATGLGDPMIHIDFIRFLCNISGGRCRTPTKHKRSPRPTIPRIGLISHHVYLRESLLWPHIWLPLPLHCDRYTLRLNSGDSLKCSDSILPRISNSGRWRIRPSMVLLSAESTPGFISMCSRSVDTELVKLMDSGGLGDFSFDGCLHLCRCEKKTSWTSLRCPPPGY